MKKHLTLSDRGAIEVLLKERYSVSEIGRKLGRDKSVISREINNRTTPNGYFADIAQLDYERNRKGSRKRGKIVQLSLMGNIESSLRKGWSPEQIAGRMRVKEESTLVSVETIYKFIYESTYGKEAKLYQYLRYGRKKRRKQKGRNVHCSKIPNKVSIHDRPEVVTKRTEIGHWEGDSVIYANKKAINTLNELKSGKVQYTKLERKTAELTQLAIEKATKKFKFKSLTVDNGTEFTNHEMITINTGVPIYFADPYSSWQRGSNENSNMLLRGFLPKKSNIDKLTQKDLNDIAEELNSRPRKRLGYETPDEVYLSYFSLNSFVAFETRM